MKGHNYGTCRKCGKIHAGTSKPGMLTSSRKGLSLEQIFGKERSEQIRDKISSSVTVAMTTKEVREKHLLGIKNRRSYIGVNNPFYGKTKQSWSKGLTKDTSDIIKSYASKCGHDYSGVKNPFYGRKHTDKSKALIKEKCWGTPELRQRKVDKMKETLSLPEKKAQRSRINIELWKTTEYREKTIHNILKSLFKRPSGYEQRLIELCNKYSLPYKYVGDGEFILAGKNPDFVNINGKKEVLEIYSIAHLGIFKPIDYEQKRSSLFASYGYKTRFITELELFGDNWEQKCLSKINGGVV